MSDSIIIIGGGLGGLTLAVMLQKLGRTATVYERDPAQGSRNQGGTLDMHPGSGQHALASMGLWEGFAKLARPEGEQTRILDKDGRVYRDEKAEDAPTGVTLGEGRPEIDRPALRNLLLSALQPGTVHWSMKLVGLRPAEDNAAHWTATFADGTTATAALVVGADGAHSQVRGLLTAAVPRYVGITFVEMGLPHAAATHPEIAALVGQGSLVALSDGKGLFGQLNGDGRIRTYAALHLPEDWGRTSGLPFDRPAEAKEAIINTYYKDWMPELQALVREGDDMIVPRPIYELPAGTRWARRTGVALLGDAAHVMPPNGEGANLAMLDAVELAEALVSGAPMDEAIAGYEAKMWARVDEEMESPIGLDFMLGPDGGAANLEAKFAELMALGAARREAELAAAAAAPA